MTPRASERPLSAGLFLISAAVLALQVLQTRILSVQMWHHHSYMVVTMTLLGWAAAGALVAVRPKLLEGALSARLAWCGALYAASTLLGYLLLSATADRAADMSAQGRYLMLSLFYSYLLLPYFFGGLLVTLVLSSGGAVHRLYFVNLLGSAVGTWLYIACVAWLGAERLLVLCAAAGPLAGLCFLIGKLPESEARARRGALLASLIALLACALLLPSAPRWLSIEVASSKAMAGLFREHPDARRVDSRWSALCRLDLVQEPETDGRARPILIFQDGDAITVMHSDASWAQESPVALNTLTYLPHALRRELSGGPGPAVLAIGIGGGIDLRYALAQGAARVLGIEINPVTVELVGSTYREFNGDIYHRPGVEVRVGEGRSALRRLDERFDVIQLSGTDTYTAGNAGAYVLSESYLYTREALREYLEHLNPQGTLGIIRLDYEPPRESLRLFGIGLTALRDLGVARPSQHAVAIQQAVPHPLTGEMIRFTACVFAPGELDARSLALYRQASSVKPYRLLYAPGIDGGAPSGEEPSFAELGAAIDAQREQAFYDAYPWDIHPVNDDEPFFFNFHRWSALWSETSATTQWADLTGGPVGLKILATLLVQTSLLTALLVIVPLLLMRREGLRASGAWRHIGYFLGLGAAFMFLEISTVQRMVLFLGHPTYSLTVVLFCFLLFAGLGSRHAGRYVEDPAGALRRIGIALVALIALYAFALEGLLDFALAWPLAARIAWTALLLAPLNFLMGMPFPIGLARLQRLEPRLVPWALGANGGASVVASILCIALAMQSGFRVVSLLALATYALAVWLYSSGPLARAKR